jgi:hypothetical protein
MLKGRRNINLEFINRRYCADKEWKLLKNSRQHMPSLHVTNNKFSLNSIKYKLHLACVHYHFLRQKACGRNLACVGALSRCSSLTNHLTIIDPSQTKIVTIQHCFGVWNLLAPSWVGLPPPKVIGWRGWCARSEGRRRFTNCCCVRMNNSSMLHHYIKSLLN